MRGTDNVVTALVATEGQGRPLPRKLQVKGLTTTCFQLRNFMSDHPKWLLSVAGFVRPAM